MRRLLALVGAIIMIGVALLVRSALDGDERAGGDGADRDGPVQIVCTTDLAAVCEAWDREDDDVDARAEPAATTAATLSGGGAELDAWLAPAPWVDAAASAAGAAIGERLGVLGRARVAIAVRPDVQQPLQRACGGTITWRCLGDLAEETAVAGVPGRVEVGLPDVDAGSGLGVLGAATTGYFGRADFAANDFADPGFDQWLAGLAANDADIVRVGRHPIDRLVTELGRFAAVGALEVDVARLEPGTRISVTYPAPVATVDVVLVPVGGRVDPARLLELAGRMELSNLLEADGWRAPADPELPEGSNQPRGGVLAALLDRWREVR